ncbi:hypothetical protein GGH93_006162 [Coemansia aciculifera]|nr:hypothetical protein GGH93_006162 [Coemansia aciculifera]
MMHDVGLVLMQLPNLLRLEVVTRVQRPIPSDSELIRVLQNAEDAQLLTPLNTSLKLARVWRSKYCIIKDQLDPRQSSNDYVSFFRTMIVELVCRLPSLEILWFNVSPIDGVQDATRAFVDSRIASEHIEHLQHF